MKYIRYILAFILLTGVAFAQENRVPPAPDAEDKTLQYFFKGAWLPSLDPAEIGAENYRELRNLRYGPDNLGLEGVQGYTKINSTILDTYTKIRSGHQLKTDRTVESYVLVQAENSAETASRLWVNETAIPAAGDFAADTEVELNTSGNHYRDDTAAAGLGRFSDAPLGSVTYCNGAECLVWSGEEMRVGGFFTMANADPYNVAALPVSGTEAVNNSSATTGNTVVVGTGTRDYFLVLTTRPIQGVYFDLSVVNSVAAVLDVHYWKNDATWAAITETDGTLTGTETLSQDGWVMWDHITDVAPYHYEGNYLYAYRFGVNAAVATIQYMTVNAPMQSIVDLWDGVPRQPISFQVWRNGNGVFKDWTPEVNLYSYESAPFVAQLDALAPTGTDYIIVMSDDRLSGIQLDFMAGYVNENASVANVLYWNGSAYAAVPGTEVDGTSLGGKAFGKNGLLWWQPPPESSEAKKTEFGVTGYSYKIDFTLLLSGTYTDEGDIMTTATDIALDVVTVIPAQNTVPAFKFPSQYKNRVLLCGYIQSKEGNRCDYAQTSSTEIWNGAESSDIGTYSLYFGGSENLTAGHEIYNRYGSQVITLWTAFKDGESYVLKGDNPEDFTIEKVSSNIGCPAPLTLASVEVAYEVADDIRRNLLIWLSDVGPYTFDGQVLSPIEGVEKYFDPDNAESINFDAIERARGWYNALKREYNLLIPSGASQATNNVWLVYDLLKKKWFRKDTGVTAFPQVGFPVQDVYGTKYTYGGIDSGYMMRLENGPSWDGTPIEQVVETGDFWPTGNIWDLTRIRKIKFMAKRISEEHELTVRHFPDTDEALGLSGIWMDETGLFVDWEGGEWASSALASIELYLTGSLNRIARATVQDNLFGWMHRFEFSISTDETTKGLQPLGWGILFHKEDRYDQ